MSPQTKCMPQYVPEHIINHSPGNSAKFPLSRSPQTVSRHAKPRLSCEVQNGVPVVHQGVSSYYIFNQDGQRLLILSRKEQESIVINNSIDIVVLEVKNNEVKLGITGPTDMVVRCEDKKTAPRPR